MADCNTPTQQPCGPGPYDSPICYLVPPSLTVLPGFQRTTLNPDCSAATLEILDDALAPVVGAVVAGCDPLAPPSCCDPASLCAILQGLTTQVPGITDTALFVDPIAGCFLGVPGAGGGGFPGYGAPVTTACANAAGVSLLVSRSDHVHRSAIPVDDEGVLVGTRCSLNFIGAGVTAVDNPGLDRVDVTIPGPVFPLLAPDGTCALPSYSFASSPDSGMFYTGTAVRISDDNCTDFIEVGASINVFTTASNVAVMSGAQFTVAAATNIVETAAGTWAATATSTADLQGSAVTITSAVGATTLDATTSIELRTAATQRLLINAMGAWNVSAGGFGVAGQAILSNGAGVAPTWQTITPSGIGANQTITVQDAGAVEVVDPATLNFNDGFVVTPAGALATIDLDYGVPIATAQANAAGVATTVARSDHVHRTIVLVDDGGVLTSSRPALNFIDGTGITVAVADNGGSDRADVTISSSTGMTGFATPTVAADAAAATGGAATTAIRSDAKLQVSTGTPTVTVKSEATAASTGVAATLLRTDAQIQALTAAPSVNVLSDASTFSQGAASSLLRSDCRFIATTAVPVATGTANAQGVATTLARSDHVHLTSFVGMVFSRGATVLNPAVQNTIVWRAPFSCTVTNVRGYRVGGTGATINARRNGVSNHLAAAVSLAAADTWVDGGAVANTAYVAGDKLEIMVVTITGVPTQIAVQVDYTRA